MTQKKWIEERFVKRCSQIHVRNSTECVLRAVWWKWNSARLSILFVCQPCLVSLKSKQENVSTHTVLAQLFVVIGILCWSFRSTSRFNNSVILINRMLVIARLSRSYQQNKRKKKIVYSTVEGGEWKKTLCFNIFSALHIQYWPIRISSAYIYRSYHRFDAKKQIYSNHSIVNHIRNILLSPQISSVQSTRKRLTNLIPFQSKFEFSDPMSHFELINKSWVESNEFRLTFQLFCSSWI